MHWHPSILVTNWLLHSSREKDNWWNLLLFISTYRFHGWAKIAIYSVSIENFQVNSISKPSFILNCPRHLKSKVVINQITLNHSKNFYQLIIKLMFICRPVKNFVSTSLCLKNLNLQGAGITLNDALSQLSTMLV